MILLVITFFGFVFIYAVIFFSTNFIANRKIKKNPHKNITIEIIPKGRAGPLRTVLNFYGTFANLGIASALAPGFVTLLGIVFVFVCIKTLVGSIKIDSALLITLIVAEIFFAIHTLLIGGFKITGYKGIGKDFKTVNSLIIDGKLDSNISDSELKKIISGIVNIPIGHTILSFISTVVALITLGIAISRVDINLFLVTFYDVNTLLIVISFIIIHCSFTYFASELILSPWMINVKKILRKRGIEYQEKSTLDLTQRAFMLLFAVIFSVYGTFILLYKSYNEPYSIQSNYIIMAILFGVIICIMLIMIIFRSIVLQFREINKSVAALANEEIEYSYPIIPDEEFIKATNVINNAIETISQNRTNQQVINEKLKYFNTELEKKVNERTSELEKALGQAKESDKLKSTFLATMSHEIRTPLNPIIGYVDILLRNKLLPENLKSYVLAIKESSSILLNVMNNIIDFAKIESGILEIESSTFNLHWLMLELIDQTRKQINNEEKKISLKSSYDYGISDSIECDDIRLKQILGNILSNAVKFTDNGFINFDVKLVNDKKLLFRITDTGIGIDNEKLENVFKQFYQVDLSTTRIYGGSGLGLTIAQRLITLMNGSIKIESEPDKGTTVSIELPYFPAVINEDNLEKQISEDNIYILVIVSNTADQLFIKDTLNSDSIHILIAENEREATELYSNFKDINIILVSMQDNAMDYEKLIVSIRNIEKVQKRIKSPIIIMSSDSDKPDSKEVMDWGADYFIYKPHLSEKINSMLEDYIT